MGYRVRGMKVRMGTLKEMRMRGMNDVRTRCGRNEGERCGGEGEMWWIGR